MHCGLLGRKLSHSYSPQIHNYLGSYTYQLYEKEPDEVGSFLKSNDFDALNVTIPYKKDVIPFCSELSPAAKKLGAVNTIIRRKDGALYGHNTDYFGFLSTVKKTGLSIAGKKALVLGSGGASVTAVAVLKEMGARVITISRNGENNYDNLSLHGDASLIVNATPVGMYPNNGQAPVDLSMFSKLEGVIDMIYNPSRTALLQQAAARGIVAENGLWMLVAQAKESAEWFTGSPIPESSIHEIYQKLNSQMQNIILVGMPGCGKSTIGIALSKLLGRSFVDADKFLVENVHRSIPDIFAQDGEDTFRRLETESLSELGKRSGQVIATGGGCVTRRENYPLLHQNGTIVWLQRPIEQLPTDGRPLSQKTNLTAMYRTRAPMYEAFSDCIVRNDSDAISVARRIMEAIQQED